jgi:hypothetical protein
MYYLFAEASANLYYCDIYCLFQKHMRICIICQPETIAAGASYLACSAIKAGDPIAPHGSGEYEESMHRPEVAVSSRASSKTAQQSCVLSLSGGICVVALRAWYSLLTTP